MLTPKYKRYGVLAVALILALPGAVWAQTTNKEPPPEVPVPGVPTVVDFGAQGCIVCVLMAPTIEELAKEYGGKASIFFVDIWKHRELGQRFHIRTIPTQVFFDAKGQEAKRHEGYLDKKGFVGILSGMGVSP